MRKQNYRLLVYATELMSQFRAPKLQDGFGFECFDVHLCQSAKWETEMNQIVEIRSMTQLIL